MFLLIYIFNLVYVSYNVKIIPYEKECIVNAKIIPPEGLDTLKIGITPHYAFLKNYYRFIEEMEIKTEKGDVRVEKRDSSKWFIYPSTPVYLSYKISLTHWENQNLLTDRKSHVEIPFCDKERIFLTGHAIFIYPVNWTPEKYKVKFDLPFSWKEYIPWEKVGEYYITEDPLNDYLAFGKWKIYKRDIGNLGLKIVISPEFNQEVIDYIFNSLLKIIKTEMKFFKNKMLNNNLMLVIFPLREKTEERGIETRGSALNNSLVFSFSKEIEDKESKVFINELFAHELFHRWNGVGFLPVYNLKDKKISCYWFTEGFTMYYAPLMLVKAGIVDSSYFFERLSMAYKIYKDNKWKDTMSLKKASFYHLTSEEANDLSYFGGMLFAFILNEEIKEKTDNKKSLDDLMRFLFENYNTKIREYKEGFGIEELNFALKKLTNRNFSQFLEKYTQTIDLLPFEEYLKREGMKVVEKEMYSLGVVIDDRCVIKEVIKGYPAENLGLLPGDRIVRVNGKKVRTRNDIEKFKVEGKNLFEIKRGNLIFKISSTLKKLKRIEIVREN